MKTEASNFLQRVRRAGLFVLFGLVLLIPKTLGLLRRAKQQKSVDEQARQLGALVVLNGGRFEEPGGKPVSARLYVAPECVHVLDLEHAPLRQIPLKAVSSLRVETTPAGCRLLVEWAQGSAAFHYDGFFAEHLAQVAETTLRSQMQRELHVIR